ncbi:thiamine pyrophosphate-binding protein [Lysinibacillus fusiformis]|uniref:thiamine pyrophosphate-binding protein n=1 Tax=Lysinibacillus fusiformis TaxID=28031 RepID=UPI00215AFFED|nr:thiamine pyrophosphate-binding protein [Lysinibacillus fusiformis]MCR8854315.1 thiamine pyrophosphate-binding protein [Lysinibacillus fusiformis]WKT77373.1 thiamine pyrophosphate-binding protein [Lysinibacillus fusiformis]
MKAARAVLEYLKNSGVQYIFGIPAGSVNAFFDELNDMSELTPIVTKHEGAASYMAAAYAKYANHLSVCIGCSGPGGTNLVTGAANAMREHLPVLFLTGAVPVNTIGLNASQELDAEPIFRPVTKYSVTVKESKDLLKEIVKASEIALSGVPGPVHIAIPIDVQHETVPNLEIPAPPKGTAIIPELDTIKSVAEELLARRSGYILVGQGVRNSVDQLLELAEILNWPIITTPQAKGYIPEDHPLLVGVFGFAGHEAASQLIADGDGQVLFIVGSSLGETATNNYNLNLTKNRFSIQMDFDQSVFNRKYDIDLPVLGDIHISLLLLIEELRAKGLARTSFEVTENKEIYEADTGEYNTKNVLLTIQKYLPTSTRYAIDIGEFMSYVIHHMKVVDYDTFNINVHFGAMGSGIGSAIGSKLAEPERPVACITGDGCFFMHGMEILTAKEYHLPILFIVMNNARLGMVYHGHALQFKRTHPSFEQHPINISAMASAMDIPSFQVTELQDLNQDMLHNLMNLNGPAVLEVVLTDNNTPPMGDRVKFLSSFGK